jgi:hypothetical protein
MKAFKKLKKEPHNTKKCHKVMKTSDYPQIKIESYPKPTGAKSNMSLIIKTKNHLQP